MNEKCREKKSSKKSAKFEQKNGENLREKH